MGLNCNVRMRGAKAGWYPIDGDAMLLPGRARSNHMSVDPRQSTPGSSWLQWCGTANGSRGDRKHHRAGSLDVLAASRPAFALRITPGKEITISHWPLSHPHFRLVNASE
jgi:hypothetical protein